jgi:hypothetical protein
MMNKIIMIMCIGVGLLSCDSDDDNNTNPPIDGAVTLALLEESFVASNGLTIALFIEDGDDKTSLFSNYVFVFNNNGTVIASNANQDVSGTFNVFEDDNRFELALNFPANPEFSELNDDWYFVMENDSNIRFDDDDDDDGDGDNIIVFQK